MVFQVLAHTVGLTNAEWRVLDTAHKKRTINPGAVRRRVVRERGASYFLGRRHPAHDQPTLAHHMSVVASSHENVGVGDPGGCVWRC